MPIRNFLILLASVLNLLWASPAKAQSGLKSFDITTNLTYGEILGELIPQAQAALDKGLNQNCYPKPLQGPYSPQFRTRYRCGEIPYGTAVSSKKKRVLQVKVPRGTTLIRLKSNLTQAQKGEPSVGAVTMRTNFQFDVLLDRAQYTSRVSTDLLDRGRPTALQVKSTIGDTLTVRHKPQGGALYSLVCAYLPGIRLQAQSTDVNLDASYTWRVLFFSATERLSVLNKVKGGALATTSGKVCGVLKTSIVKNSKNETLPKVQLLDISYPTFSGLRVQGPGVASTKVVIHTLGLKIANFLLKLFTRSSIEKMVADFIQDTVKQEVDRAIKLHISDIKSGKFFETIMKEALKKNPSADILKAYSKAISEAVDVDEISFKEDLVNQCQSLISDYLRSYGLTPNRALLAATCGGLQMDVSLLPFAANKTYAARGCYDHPHSPLPYNAVGKNTWWLRSCGLSSRIRITAQEKYIDTIKCLSTATTDSQRLSCVLVLLEDLFGIPTDLLKYLDLIDSLEDLRKIAQDLGYTEEEINAIEENFLKVIRL